MSATPAPIPGQPPGEMREGILRYFREVWPAGQRIESVKPTGWSAERDREDDDDDECEGGEFRVTFYHERDNEMTETDLLVVSEDEWPTRPQSKETCWSVVRSNGKVYALSLLTTNGKAAPVKSGKLPKMEPAKVHQEIWRLSKATNLVETQWFVISPSKWSVDPRANDPTYRAIRLNLRTVLVIKAEAI